MYEFIGRVDQQVKIRGFRVELGEIESHLNRLPGVRESVVVLKTDAANHPVLIAFWIPADQELRSRPGEALAEQLKCTLPDYMIPARFELLTALPLTPNRKVDRKFLTQASDAEILEKFGSTPVAKKSAGTPEGSRVLLEEVLCELRRLAAGILKSDEFDPHRPLGELGFDSIRFTSLSVALNQAFGLKIDATLFYHYKTLQGVAEFLLLHQPERVAQRCQPATQEKTDSSHISDLDSAEKPSSGEKLGGALLAAPGGVRDGSSPANPPVEPIAIIGMDARLPGAGDLDAFWQNLTSGRDVIREFPWERIDRRPAESDPPIWGGFIEDVDKFDAPFFGISRREASAMDPRQRLFLETVWRAIEQSGYRPGELSGTNTGVFVGIVGGAEYSGEPEDGSVDSAAQLLLGAASSLIANRVSYHLNFRGPSAPIDTACSSSLVALHRAVVSLQSGQCDLAVAGGVNLILDPEISRSGAKTGMLSPDGRCKAFDARADGYVRSEGVAALLLKPLSKARAAGDPIYGIVRGSAENHGGRAAGLTVPNPEAQSEVVAAALQRAGIDPATLTYIEAHGTGTQLGDPIEINGLKAAFEKARPADQTAGTGYCGLGSVKTNIGHLEAAAGLAGVVKVLLALRHGEIPANLHFQSHNPKIQLEGSPFFIVDRRRPWNRLKDRRGEEIPRRAGVSSFGFSGVNAHVVIEEYPRPAELVAGGPVPVDEPVLIVLSARTKDRLSTLASNLAGHLEPTAAKGGTALIDIAYTLQVGREPMAERIAFIARSPAEVCQKLRQVAHDPEIATFRGNIRDKERFSILAGGEAGASFLQALVDNRDWERLGQLWVSGIELDWKLLYPGNRPRRLSLPAYPFDRRTYWLRPRKPLTQAVTLGPLLDGPIPDREAGGIFVKRFGPSERVLAEHRVAGRSILPAAAFLEMVRTAATAIVADQSVQFNSVVWLRPLENSRAAETQVRLRREKEQIRFTVESDGDGERLVHAQGEVRYVPEPAQPEAIDLPAIRSRCLHELEGPNIYERFVQAGMEYGPYFQSLERLWIGGHEVLGKLRLPPVCEGERGAYLLHPSLLDGALQTAAGSRLVTDRVEPQLPFSVDRVEIFGPLERELWVYVRRAAETSLLLADVEGRVVVKLSDYQTRPVKDHGSAERSSKSASSSVFDEALRNIESMPETDFGLDPAKVDFECRGFELLEQLGRLALLKTLQNIGIFRTPGEEIDRESLRRVLGAVPKYYRLCDALVYFLKQGGFVEESGGSVRAAASLAEPATQRALAELGLEQERYYREFPNLTPYGTLLWSCIDDIASSDFG